MRVVGVAAYAEPVLHKTFGTIGVWTSRAPYVTVPIVIAVLVALCGGLWTIEEETNANDLLIARRGRIAGEKEFYVDNFDLISPVLSSVIVTPKPGVDIFGEEALDEVYELQKHIRTFGFEYGGRWVSLEQFCFKTIDDDPTEPCWQSSLLESFREGDVFNVGGENNTDYAVLFQARPSYREFNFSRDLTRSFIAQTNLNPDSLLLGGFEVDPKDQDTITHVSALQIAFGAKAPKGLQQKGLQYYEWKEKAVNEDTCADPSRCEACADNLQPTAFAAAGCTFDGASSQSQSCCDAITPVRESPCVETIFERRPEVPPIANPLFTACGLTVVEIQPRCQNRELIVGNRRSSATPEVCVCLAGASDACTAAAGAFLGENPEYQETFAAATSEDEAAIAELGRVLIEDVGCPADAAVNPLCSCLEDYMAESCAAALPAYLQENPEREAIFVNAGTGNEEAQAEVATILVDEFGCTLPEGVTAGAETTQEPICSCLVDANSGTCTAAAAAFLQENPNQTETFTAATAGDVEAQTQLGVLLVSEFGCELPEAAANAPSVEAETQDVNLDAQIQYEAIVTTVHDLTDTIDKARELMHAWERAWREGMEEVAAQYEHINVVWLTSTSIDDEVAEAAEAEFDLFVMGYGLVLAYILIFVTFDWKLTGVRLAYYPPGPGISALCFFTVLLSVAAAMGVAGYVSAVSSFKISFSTIQMVPLLMLGLGVNDFFVLCSAFKSVLSNPDRPSSFEGIMYEAMAIGGTSITLSSVANTAAFSLGALSAVPIVLWFCVQMAVGIVIAYVVSIVAIPSLLSIAVRHHLEGKPDFLLRLVGVRLPDPPASETVGEGEKDGRIAQGIRRFRWPLTFTVFTIFAVWMAFGIRYMVSFEQGLDLSESVQKGSYSYHFLKASEDYFDTNQINIVFRDSVDYTNPDDFQAARQSEFEYVDEGYRTEKQLMAQSWMEFYTQYVETKFCSNEICMDEVHWYYDGFSSAEFAHPSKNICADAESAEECEEICATHCPQGEVGTKERCQYKENSMECYCPYRPMLKSRYFYENPAGFNSKIESYWVDFLNNTATGRASRVFINLDEETTTKRNKLGAPKGTRSYVYARGLSNVPHQLDHLQKGREILDRQAIDVYPFDYVVYAVGEQYEDLPLETVEAVGISMAVATVVMLPLIVNIFAALIVSVCVLLSVLLSVGMSSWTVINLDYSAYVAFIVTVGLSVEFCAHIARDFMLAKGDRLTRSLHALRTMGIAVLNGGVTTFLGILPSSLSDLPPIRDRLFVQFSIIVLAGMFIGLLFLPTILSLVGPSSFYQEEPKDKAKVSQKVAEP